MTDERPASTGAHARILGIALALLLALGCGNAEAQEAEPRSYSNTPVGLNFLIAGHVYAQGKMAFDPDLSIADATFRSNTELLAYVRSFDLAGQSAKFDMIVPSTSFRAEAFVDGQPHERAMSGPGDPRFRLSVNLFGAPALSAKEFASYRQDTILGVSLQVSAPLGTYDNTKLLNLGNNRWSFKPELGISKAWGAWTFEVAPSATFFTHNTDFLIGNTFAQAPVYALQTHLLYNFTSGAWISLDGIYFEGGRTSLNGVQSDNAQRNTRAGFTVALPVDRQNSVKLSASTGVTTRTGTQFTALAVGWQYRWGERY
jgi:hypothetical protein